MASFLRWFFGIRAPATGHSMAENNLDLRELDRILLRYTSELPHHLQGVSFSVFNKDGRTLYSKAYGTRTLGAGSEPLSIETPIWTSSLTKLITTLACMIAVDQGLIGLDDNVRNVIPELKDVKLLVGFENSDHKPRKAILENVVEPITMRQLLSHTSGLTYDVFDAGLMEWSHSIGRTAHSHCGSLEGYMHPLIHTPGRGWAYGPGMDWAGRAVETLSGQSLEEFIQKNICLPLDMHSTTFRPENCPDYLSRKMDHATRDLKTSALLPGGGHHLLALPAKDCIGGMGLYSTPSELLKVLKEVLAGGGKIIKRGSIAEMLKTQLNDETQTAFMKVIDGKARTHLRQTWPDGFDGTFGLSASINLTDFPGRRLKNSINWAGSSGLHATHQVANASQWIDPTTGIGGLVTTQLAPPGDPMFTKCFLDLESAVYLKLRRVN